MEQKIPPTGRAKLYLEESQNKSACQKNEILLLPLHAMAENIGLVRKDTTTWSNSRHGRSRRKSSTSSSASTQQMWCSWRTE